MLTDFDYWPLVSLIIVLFCLSMISFEIFKEKKKLNGTYKIDIKLQLQITSNIILDCFL